jgi:hypothetical protein
MDFEGLNPSCGPHALPVLHSKKACQEKNRAFSLAAGGAPWARGRLAKTPPIARIAVALAILLPVLALTNLAYHVIRKPTELFFFVGHRLDKEPAETWHQYGGAVPHLFHQRVGWVERSDTVDGNSSRDGFRKGSTHSTPAANISTNKPFLNYSSRSPRSP